MKQKTLNQLESDKQKIDARLAEARGGMKPRGDGPEFAAPRAHYELSERVHAISHGGIGVAHNLVRSLGLPEMIDEWLPLLKQYHPYHESDHVLNITFNALCGGRVLDDIERLRNDATYLDALGARAIPDPTTAADFCRRFKVDDVWTLMGIINTCRVAVWQQAGPALLDQRALLDVDSTIVETKAECLEGMDMSYKGVWGYHPLLVSLANTSEPLFLVNRSGNRPSSEGAPEVIDEAVDLCRQGGFTSVLVRGDSAFSTTAHFDRWNDDGVCFVFGYGNCKSLTNIADALPKDEYELLVRKADRALAEKSDGEQRAKKTRAKKPRVKDRIIKERGYYNIKLESEEIAEFEHKPSRAKQSYRMIVLRKNIIEERGQLTLGNKVRYFFYVTNDRDLTAKEVVFHANERCNQENLIAQLKGGGVNSLKGSLNQFVANWALMVMVALAWTLKAWMALTLPEPAELVNLTALTNQPELPETEVAELAKLPELPELAKLPELPELAKLPELPELAKLAELPELAKLTEQHKADINRILRMDFRTFVLDFIQVPAQILLKGRQLIYRVLAWRPNLPLVFRMAGGSG